ncbi:MAG: sel1 repeat family protein [Victivallales bacterium]|nr:sel1 repeat family protein [Victivallales bacterium]
MRIFQKSFMHASAVAALAFAIATLLLPGIAPAGEFEDAIQDAETWIEKHYATELARHAAVRKLTNIIDDSTLTEQEKTDRIRREFPEARASNANGGGDSPAKNGRAEQESAEEQFQRALQCYEAGNYAEAVKWFRKAAGQGLAEAQYNLGVCYATGLGVEQDYAEAVKWFRKAAEQGNAGAQVALRILGQ